MEINILIFIEVNFEGLEIPTISMEENLENSHHLLLTVLKLG